MTKPDYTNKVANEVLNGYIAALTMSGGGAFNDMHYFTCFNTLHSMEYFSPNTARNIHIFMTRPYCNISPINIANDASFLQCCYSYNGSLLLASLMPPMAKGISRTASVFTQDANGSGVGVEGFEKLMKEEVGSIPVLGATPFIPLISNLSTGISGIKDVTMDKYEYDGDLMGNKPVAPMGLDNYHASGEFSINYIEHNNLSVSMLHFLWLIYMDKVGKGLMFPTDKHVTELIYDYMASVYWFVTGEDGMSIKLYGKQTGIFPLDFPISSLIPSERGTSVDSKMTFTYAYNHSEVMNPEILNDFNATVDLWVMQAPSGPFEGQVNVVNSIFDDWRKNNFVVNPPTLPDGNESRNIKYKRIMATPSSNSNKKAYENSVFIPEPQNTWNGHPYIINGKLVYRALYGRSKPRPSA